MKKRQKSADDVRKFIREVKGLLMVSNRNVYTTTQLIMI